MKQVHLTFQGKGGIGKSFIASLLGTYFKEKDADNLICIDTDPTNQTFSHFKDLNVEFIKITDENNNKIIPTHFDKLIELILTTDKEIVVVDTGATSFIALGEYIAENHVFQLLKQSGCEVTLHSIVTGGQALVDTFSGFAGVADNFGDECSIVLWLNEFFGQTKNDDGKEITETDAYQARESDLHGLVRLEAQNPQTYGHDLARMIKAGDIFTTAANTNNPAYNIMARQRLKWIWDGVREKLDGLHLA